MVIPVQYLEYVINRERNNKVTERECMCTTPEYTIKLNQQGPPGPKGATGNDGFSPIVGVATQTDDVYILNITTSEGVMQTPNLQGRGVPANGSSGQWLIADGNNISHWEDVPNASQLNSGMIKLSTANDIYNLDSDTDWEPNDSNAVTSKTMGDATADANAQVAEATPEDEVKLKTVDEHIVQIYDLLHDVVLGTSSLKVSPAMGSVWSNGTSPGDTSGMPH